MPGVSYINDHARLHCIIKILEYEICRSVLLLQVIVYISCPEYGKHSHHNKLKCTECGVCLHAYCCGYGQIILLKLCVSPGLWHCISCCTAKEGRTIGYLCERQSRH